MIAFLTGKIAAKFTNCVHIETSGVGFEVSMPQSSIAALPAVGEAATVLTYLHVRDDGMTLFGFLTPKEKAMFEKLMSVSGVGPKAALSALSAFSADELGVAIATQDVATVSKIPGVGKKTAQRIILDLKGSFDMNALSDAEGSAQGAGEGAPASAQGGGVREALLSMGFVTAEIDLALRGAPENASEQELLHYALKRMAPQ